MTDLPTQASATRGPAGRKLHEIIAPAWAERKRIFMVAFAAGILTLILNFLILPLYYKATATLLPETEKSKLGALSQFSGLAQLAGVNVSGSEISRLYPLIASSETVLRPVIARTYVTKKYAQPVDLITYFKIDEDTPAENMDEALRQLKELMSSSFDSKTSTVTLGLEMKEPELAADVLNTIVAGVDSFMRQKRITSASEQARWISARLEEVEGELRHSEDSLKTFKERNRRVEDSPELMLKQERLGREVTVKSAIYLELKKQLELARIEEIKNISVVNVLDSARAPVRKERPKRATNTVAAFILALVALGTYYSLKPVYEERVREFVKKVGGEK